ncbi:MAG TPA: DUF1801 domain-containing protein [Phnomibacter sp.]|nr:DUF1801 domain-containing protein [Phnomibacter sp.]
MPATYTSVTEYLASLPAHRQPAMQQLRQTMLNHLPPGFEETMQYGMISYVVPHSIYPPGYHTNPKDALPFICIASQKSHIAVYHMGMYSQPHLLDWFTAEFAKHSTRKLNMGKSCIRFKKPEDIPFALLGQLAAKLTVQEVIQTYEAGLRKGK